MMKGDFVSLSCLTNHSDQPWRALPRQQLPEKMILLEKVYDNSFISLLDLTGEVW